MQDDAWGGRDGHDTPWIFICAFLAGLIIHWHSRKGVAALT
jgi:hypothetical protein